MIAGKGLRDGFLSERELADLTAGALASLDLKGKRVLILTPDSTRTCPMPFLFRQVHKGLKGVVKKQTWLIALGTHPPMSDAAIGRLFGLTPAERAGEFADAEIVNHDWQNRKALAKLGTILADEVEEISEGLLREDVVVECNRLVLEHDHILIIGPTFPHEVVGFSGGNKYFFPGVSGPEVLNFFHWLGALITNVRIIGVKNTPVREVVDRAAAMIGRPKTCFSLVTTHDGVRGLFVGTPEEAWDKAADLSAATQIIYKERTFERVLSCAPEMYDDIWTAGKCMYKLEPVVADGGELIIYAPHVTEVSYTHGRVLDRIGYHCRDYFVKQMDRFKDVPRGVLAHSTHVHGLGTYENGREQRRVNVVLATQIPAERCRRINLGYRDPKTVDPAEYADREDEGYLYVPRAGEFLYRLTGGRLPTVG